MPLTRRTLLTNSASLTALATLRRLGLAQAQHDPSWPAAPPTDTDPIPASVTKAAKALQAHIATQLGSTQWDNFYHRIRTLNTDLATHGLRPIDGIPNATFLTGYPNNEFYDWDLYFENLYLSYYGIYPWCFSNLKEFLNRQQPDGYISRSLIHARDRQHFKPFLAQLVVLGAKQDSDNYTWLRGNYYDRLAKYLTKWFSYDNDHNGLPVWNSCDAAGTDNQWSRAGGLASFEVEGVDLASYLVRELRAMAVIATHLNLKSDAAAYTKHADEVIRLINATFWDEKEGMYFDQNEKTGKRVPVKSATSFTPLFAGAVPAARAKRMIHEHLLNPAEFWLAYPVASYAKTEPDYYQGAHITYAAHRECNWRGPNWAPTNYMIFEGLRAYGYHAEARDLANRCLDQVLVKNPILREYYNAETGEGIGKDRFWGFTSLYFGMVLETLTGYDASSLDKPNRSIFTSELGIQFPPVPKA
jgi:hypothetical protein